MTGKEIRSSFIKFFGEKGHKAVDSSPLVPHGDPTLLFTNAGMVQFKSLFLGDEERDYKKAVTVQKCLRAGGKHNDLENVGRTARHHTFFEMLGNFSFGDYFKAEAIEMAWEYLTAVLKLDEDRLIVTIFDDDDEAGDIWEEKIGLSKDKIVRCGEKDNFWSMGDTGPCGPCSEIHYDQGPTVGCGRPECDVECECDRYLEIWNLVFMQYNRDENGIMTPLPKPSIDTGMGLERLAAVVQGKASNYDSDIFAGIFRHIEEMSGRLYGDNESDNISMRVIADHIRATTFLISDGVLPSNEGRGYVLRRVMRRAARHGRRLGMTKPFLHLTAGAVADEMGHAYPALIEARSYAARVILSEEERFLNTLDHGMKLLEDEVEKLKKDNSSVLPGDIAFKLYDTFGFPLDLTEDILKEEGMAVDQSGFDDAMEKQKDAARQAWAGSGEDKVSAVYTAIAKEGIAEPLFVGYEQLETEATVTAIIKDGASVGSASEGEEVELITDRSVFYGESGGQKGDEGLITNSSGTISISITDTKKPLGALTVHKGKIKKGAIKKGDKLLLKVNAASRAATSKNHTATHLLQSALRQVLGDHVKQAGSLVGKDRLRFDFTHFTSLSAQEVSRIEEIVNQQIWENKAVETELLSIADAKAKGATALFGEKYGDEVRVVTVPDFSMELCGGTHVGRIGEIGPFKILSEGGIAAGVRRIEGITSALAYKTSTKREHELKDIGTLLKGQPGDIIKKVEALLQKQKAVEAELGKLKDRLTSSGSDDLMAKVVETGGIKLLSTDIEGADGQTLRTLMDNLKEKIGSGVVVLGSSAGGKVSLIAGVTKDLTDRFHAGKIIGAIAPIVGGKGGGRPDMAQAGGKDVSKLGEALAAVKGIIEKAE
ncbi:MAG: alanine--tRNA ligase [bacterium]|nr:alanine--tRNA ligase [bacterium]